MIMQKARHVKTIDCNLHMMGKILVTKTFYITVNILTSEWCQLSILCVVPVELCRLQAPI